MSDYLDMEATALDVARTLDVFHFTELARRTGQNEETVRRYILRWEREGKVRLARKEGNRRFYIAADKPVPLAASVEPGRTPEGNMWRAMALLGQFSPLDLAAHSNAGGIEVTVEKAASYCRLLLDAGYLRVMQTARPGSRPPVYKLIRKTGPLAPQSRRVTGLWDPNTRTFDVKLPEQAT